MNQSHLKEFVWFSNAKKCSLEMIDFSEASKIDQIERRYPSELRLEEDCKD